MQDSDKTTNATPPRKIINKENNMSIIQYEPVHIGDFSSFIENLVSKTKSKDLEQGLLKLMEVIELVSLISNIVRLGNKLMAQCINEKVKLELLKGKTIF